jgi:hypothetical protein
LLNFGEIEHEAKEHEARKLGGRLILGTLNLKPKNQTTT